MAEYTQQNRILAFTSPLGADTLLAVRFTGSEEVSELFDYQVDLYADSQTTINSSALIGKRVTVALQVTDAGTHRYFNGIVASLESGGGDSFFHTYRVRMVPTLWLLSLNQQTRVFQDKSVLDILREVLAPYSIVPRIETQAAYLPLEYCTQYRETDLDFLARILQQQGIFFYFTHTQADHVISRMRPPCSRSARCAVTSPMARTSSRSSASMTRWSSSSPRAPGSSRASIPAGTTGSSRTRFRMRAPPPRKA